MKAIGVLLILACGVWADPVLYLNGGADPGSPKWFNSEWEIPSPAVYTIYDDFKIASQSVVTGLSWVQFEQSPVIYTSTTLTVYRGIPVPSNLVSTREVTATRVLNGLASDTSGLPLPNATLLGYEYSVSGMSLNLAAGTYYLGIHNNVDVRFGVTLVATGEGAIGATDGFYQLAGGGLETKSGYTAFALRGTPVPELGTLAALGWAFGAYVVWRRRRRSNR